MRVADNQESTMIAVDADDLRAEINSDFRSSLEILLVARRTSLLSKVR